MAEAKVGANLMGFGIGSKRRMVVHFLVLLDEPRVHGFLMPAISGVCSKRNACHG